MTVFAWNGIETPPLYVTAVNYEPVTDAAGLDQNNHQL